MLVLSIFRLISFRYRVLMPFSFRSFCQPCVEGVLAKEAVEHDDQDEGAIRYAHDERACPQ